MASRMPKEPLDQTATWVSETPLELFFQKGNLMRSFIALVAVAVASFFVASSAKAAPH